MWDSQDRENPWTRREWSKRDTLKAGMPNVVYDPILRGDKITSSRFHTKLGLMKQLVKALRLDGEGFEYLLHKIPGLSYEKIKAGVFDGPQIRALVRDQTFVQTMNDKKVAWLSFVDGMKNYNSNQSVVDRVTIPAGWLSDYRHCYWRGRFKFNYRAYLSGQGN